MYNYLDNDLYKFTTSYAYMKMFPDAEGVFTFKDRDNYQYSKEEVSQIKELLQEMCNSQNINYLDLNWLKSSIRFIPLFYWEWFKGFKFSYDKIEVSHSAEGILTIIVTDKLYKCTLYEVPILAVVSSVRGKKLTEEEMDKVKNTTKTKCALAERLKLKFSEFGTRRRHSLEVQQNVISILKNYDSCVGTSNVLLAMRYDMRPIGTHPHEWFMFHGAQFGYKMANYLALENWQDVYDGDLGIALSDTYTVDAFLNNFSRKLAKLYDGVRHDSGDPFRFVDKVCARYRQLGINPMTKTIVFSNALTMPVFAEIANYCEGKINCSAGIGTNLTFDIPNQTPPNIVMKLSRCRMSPTQEWRECIKLSDDAGKYTGDLSEIKICIHELKIKSN